MNPLPAVITGASRGLGAGFALALAEYFHIIAVGRTVGALEELDDQIQAHGGRATLCPIDITNQDAIDTLCEAIRTRWGGIALWVHTAIYAPPLSPAPHIDGKDFAKAFETNVFATQRLIVAFSALMSADSGAVFFEDKPAHGAFWGAYGASKAAQITLAQSWARESVKIGPKIALLCPNPVASATRARFYPGEDRSKLASPKDEVGRLMKELFAHGLLAPSSRAG